MKKRSLGIALLSMVMLLTLFLAGCSTSSTADKKKTVEKPAAQSSQTLAKIKSRGKIIVGVNGKLPGFGFVDKNGNYSGFDVDFAKALAAAIFNDTSKVEFRPLSASERFTALQTGEIDVLIRNTTRTLTRDTDVGGDFVATTFYDGQGIMVRKDSNINSLKDLAGARIGVGSGTTTELNLADTFRRLGIKYEPVVFDDQNALIAAYDKGSVDAWTTDKSGLVARQSTLKDPSAHKILDATLSKEPLGPMVRQDDAQWKDIVNWVTLSTFQAEEFGITSKNVDKFLNDSNPKIRRFLGKEGDLGKKLGLSNDFAVRVLKAVGNYAEIYDRNLGPNTIFNLPRGLNNLYTNGGILYSPPFR